MPRRPSLPERLSYLEPFRRVLNRLEPEEFNEDMDQSLLHKFVLKRTEGLSTHEAAKLLENDQTELKAWTSDYAPDEKALVWLETQLAILPDLMGELRSRPAAVNPKRKVEMKLPEGARSRSMQNGAVKISWKRITFMAVPVESRYLNTSMDQSSCPSDIVTRVQFGQVMGHKRNRPEFLKTGVHSVDYFLEAPGGGVQIWLLKKGGHFDESEFEDFFHTIRLVGRD